MEKVLKFLLGDEPVNKDNAAIEDKSLCMSDMSAGSQIVYLVRDPCGLSHSSAIPW